MFEEIEEGKVRKHEIVCALSKVLTPKGAQALDKMVLARRWDIYKEGFDSPEALLSHVRDITMGPMLAALDGLGASAYTQQSLEAYATQLGLMRFLRGIPALIALKVPVWSDNRKVNIYKELCNEAISLTDLEIRSPAMIEIADCQRILRFVMSNPSAVEVGAIPNYALSTTLARGLLAWRSR